MTLSLKHFDTRLNEWIKDPFNEESGILTEELDNTLLEAYFPDTKFSFGHLDENTKVEDLYNHPDGDVLLFSSKSRLLYGPAECLETIEKLCPDRKDRGAYGSLFLGSCNRAITLEVNMLVVDDETGKNGGILDDEVAYRQVGDCHGKISPDLSVELSQSDESVIQHRLAIPSESRFGKGTLAPKNLSELNTKFPEITPSIDLIVPTSSFKGGDKKNNPIKPGLHQVSIWLGEKDLSREGGKTSISQLHASFPEGIKEFLNDLEDRAYELNEYQDSHQALAEYYCKRQEERKGNTEIEPDDPLLYKLIKTDLEGHKQLLESQKVTTELKRFVQNEWKDIALGKSIKFDRAIIIPSKELKHGEICIPNLPEEEEIINFRSPLLNSNGVCLSKNVYVEEAYSPNGKPLEGVIVVNDEDKQRIEKRINALKERGIETDEVVPLETETERQGRDFDGDTLGYTLASKFPKLTKEIKERNLPENAYAPIKKEKKASFYRPDGTQPPFEEIALFMSDSISVGIINNHATALEALESEIDILNDVGTNQQKAEYVSQVSKHYQKLIAQEQKKPIPEQYRERIGQIASLADKKLGKSTVDIAMQVNRSIYHDMVAEAGYQNQLAVDIFKSNRAPDLKAIEENKRLLHRVPSYIKEKKKDDVYLNSGLTTNGGLSPVELMVSQANRIFSESRLQAKAPEQFLDLFPDDYSPTQKLTTLNAKKEYDRLFEYAVKQSESVKNDFGPILKVTTEKGATVEISNLNHGLDLKNIQTLGLKNVENKNKNQSHKLIALAKINGSEKYERLGTISEYDRKELNLQVGGQTENATAKLILPLNDKQVRISFKKASEFAQKFYESIPVEEKHQYACSAWHLCHSGRDSQKGKQKTGNFVYAAFPEETIEQLQQFQVKELTITGLQKPTNRVPQEMWNDGQTLNFSIRELDLPISDERHGKKILFAEGIEMGVVSDRYLDLPNGSTFQGKIEASNIATASLKIPRLSTPIKFGKANKFDYASHHFRGEEVDVKIEYHQPPSITVLKLNGKIIGELDPDSAKVLTEKQQLVKGKSLSATLDSYGKKDNYTLHTIASLDEDLSLKLNNQSAYPFKNEQFDRTKVNLSVDFVESKRELAVKIDDKVAGVFTRNQKSSQLALARFSGRNDLNGLRFKANINSNLTIANLKIDPDTVKLGEIKKEPTIDLKEKESSVADSILIRMTQVPTLPWTYELNGERKYGVCVDHKLKDETENWFRNSGVKFKQISHLDPMFEEESKRGYAVFVLDKSSISIEVERMMSRKHGEWLNAEANFGFGSISDYHDRLEQVPELNERRRELFNEAMSSPPKVRSQNEEQQIESKNPRHQLQPINSSVAGHMKKDIAMAEVATQFIGVSAASSDVPSSTRNYQQAWGDKANTGKYTSDDIVMVSGSGLWRGVTNQQIQTTFDRHYQPLLRLAIESKATIVCGNATGTDKMVQQYLKKNNYQLKLTDKNYVECKQVIREQKSTPLVKREPWEKQMLQLAINSLNSTSDRSCNKGIFSQKYLATHNLKTDTLTIENITDRKGVVYRVQRGQNPSINNLTPKEKYDFASSAKNKNQRQMQR